MIHDCIADIKTAVALFGAVREARREGARVEVRKVTPFPKPAGKPGISFMATVEGCCLSNDLLRLALPAFRSLPFSVQRQMTFAPCDGEFIQRAQLWRSVLEPVLTPTQLHTAMMQILSWYRHIKRRRRGAVAV